MPILQNKYFSLETGSDIFDHLQKHNVIQDINNGWNKENFLTPRTPVVIARVKDKASFDKWGVPRCIHLPVKMPESDVRIPNEYLQFKETLKKIFDCERSVNPHFEDYYAYLTVDQLRVNAGESQRINGLHVDGLPRDRINPENQPIDHAYLVANVFPTRFFNQSFDMRPYDLQKHNFFDIFARLGNFKNSFQAKPVHDSPIADKDCMRTILRVEFSVLQFDRLRNSHNPCFSYNWAMVPRPIPTYLYDPERLYDIDSE
ncbi:hypothetical protein ACMFMG_002718 [Clarireedia jacksonii]